MDSLSYVSDEYLLSQAGIDTEKFKLGKLCKRGHDWEGTGKTLRYSHGSCQACKGHPDPGIRANDKVRQQEIDEQNLLEAGIDINKYKLGGLCRRGHDWNNTGRTLRWHTGKCIACNNVTVINEDDAQLLRSHDLDPERFALGKSACSKGHTWLDTGRMLQYRASYSCVDCGYINARQPKGSNTPEEAELLRSHSINPGKIFIGKFCFRGHDWNNTGKSLRYIGDGACIVCSGSMKPKPEPKTIEQRFWDNVDIPEDEENDCWEWLGYKTPAGYGYISESFDDGTVKNYGAHRLSYEYHTGETLTSDVIIRHYVCNNPSCVSPHHILPGTQNDNIQDMVMWKRHRYGENATLVKITLEQVFEIQELYATGNYSQKRIGEIFGISQTQVGRIVRGDRWQLAIEEYLAQ
jgi:predicted XRE-type DNA-binding protein